MHPILQRPGRLAPYLAACAPLVFILTALLTRPGGLSFREAVTLAWPLTIAYAFIGLSVWYVCRQFPLLRSHLSPLVATHGTAALLTSALWVLFGTALVSVAGLFPALETLPARFRTQAVAVFALGVLLYVLAAALNYVLLALEATREAEAREAEMTILARDAELAALRAQIRPHFLFNSLNSISALAGSDPARAQEMCARLGDFLRRSLSVGDKESIPVGEELALSRAYLAVEELRFGARLEVEEDLDERGGGCLLPPLLLQPLVENAVRHGIATRVEGGKVSVGIACGAGRLRILIENPFDPEAPPRPGSGMGLANVRKRLAARYGSEALFATKKLADRFLVVISVPVERAA